jgi:hypothetical protein
MTAETPSKRYKDFPYLVFVVEGADQGVDQEAVVEAQDALRKASVPRPKVKIRIKSKTPEKTAETEPIEGGEASPTRSGTSR